MKTPPALLWRRLVSGVLALGFASVALAAEPTPTPPTGAALSTPPELHPAVRAVGIHNWKGEERHIKAIYAQRGDEIWIDVHNFQGWLDSLGNKKPDHHGINDLILYLDHFPLLGVSPIYWHERTEWTPASPDGKWPSQEYTVTTVGFSLVRNDSSKPSWSHLLNQPVLSRKVIVSVGFSNGAEIDSEMTPDGKESGKLDQEFFLTVIPRYRSAFGLLVILGALIAFLILARRSHIIRDAAAPRRPDGLRPYSLARGQMAFWFFLVIASYFFRWIVTGDMDTLNTSVLGLIGISAGTALGSAFIDSSKPALAGTSGNEPPVDVTRPHLEVLEELKTSRPAPRRNSRRSRKRAPRSRRRINTRWKKTSGPRTRCAKGSRTTAGKASTSPGPPGKASCTTCSRRTTSSASIASRFSSGR